MVETNWHERPWGGFLILEDKPYTKVKRLIVNPGHRFSLQSHKYRDEHWVVVRGIALATLGDLVCEYGYGEHIHVKRGTKHRLACKGVDPLEIIEVQVGEAFTEEDIMRFADDYARA